MDEWEKYELHHDVYNGMQVYHYAVTEVFRIHVVIEAGYYKIIRLDPRHKVHRS